MIAVKNENGEGAGGGGGRAGDRAGRVVGGKHDLRIQCDFASAMLPMAM
jgi:hypothetical protein